MKIKIETYVNKALTSVKDGFTERLFLSLNPPFPPVKLKRFDGCKTGDIVELELHFPLFKQVWISEIVSDVESSEYWEFVDVGVRLPFFLSQWRHAHRVESKKNGSCIIDSINFSTGYWLLDLLMYPVLFAQFSYRKPIYRKFFT